MTADINNAVPTRSSLDSALSYLELGWALVRCVPGEKRPVDAAWQKGPAADEETVRSWFANGAQPNIGIRLGEPSGGIVDIDCDDDGLIHFLQAFAPSWQAGCPGWDRDGRPHTLVRLSPVPKPRTYTLGKKMLLEVRSDGRQTILPPSVHPSGALYIWRNGASEPPLVPVAELDAWLHDALVAFVLSRNWAEGSRNDLTLCGAGAMARAGIPFERAKRIIEVTSTAADDDEVEARLRGVEASYGRFAAGENTRGFPSLKAILDGDSAKLLTTILKGGADGPGDTPPTGPDAEPEPAASAPPDHYFARDGCTMVRSDRGPARLLNAVLRIVSEEVHDDGSPDLRRVYVISGVTRDGDILPDVRVPAREFGSMAWVPNAYGAGAVIAAGPIRKDQLREAIQFLSPDRRLVFVYGHTGWREIGTGESVYLHGGGAISKDGLRPDIAVDLPGRLRRYELPPPPTGEELVKAWQASLRFLDIAPDAVTLPLYALMLRAVLGNANVSGFLHGTTGTLKSSLAALIQQHFGAGFVPEELPGSWASTANSLEWTAFVAKDAILVVDDFLNQSSGNATQQLHREADRLIRAQGNQAGRGRMRPDGGIVPDRFPSGVILATGEDLPRGESLRARMAIIELNPGDVNREALTRCQADAAAGVFAGAMAAYLQWLAPRYPEISANLRPSIDRERSRLVAESQHLRTPVVMANLVVASDQFLEFTTETGATSAAEAGVLRNRMAAAIAVLSDRQVVHIASQAPVQRTFDLLRGALVAGAVHVKDMRGGSPKRQPGGARAWGWKLDASGNDYLPLGRGIGFKDGDDLYLEPKAAYAEAQAQARREGSALAIEPQTLFKRMSEEGVLVSRDEARQRYTVRKTVSGHRLDLLHVRAGDVLQHDAAAGDGSLTPEAEWYEDRAGRSAKSNSPGEGDGWDGQQGETGPAEEEITF